MAPGKGKGPWIIQDLGYHPLSSRFFSDLTHYVRSGDSKDSLSNFLDRDLELGFYVSQAVACGIPAWCIVPKIPSPHSRDLINFVGVGLIRGSFCPPPTRDLRT